jgi:Domain of unknown function (DUF4249)
MKINQNIIFIFLFLLNACIDPYDVNFNRNNKVLVVEGLLTDDTENPDTIKINYKTYQDKDFSILTISSLKPVIVELNSKKETPLIQFSAGNFLPPPSFKIKVNEMYLLKFSIDGQLYESTPESYIPSPPISNIYEKYNPMSRLSNDGIEQLGANEVFIDFIDIPNQKNYYLWRYTDYDRLDYCTTCYGSIYSKITESCGQPLPLGYREPHYDYACKTECFAIIRGKEINVMSDNLSDGKIIAGRMIAKIPKYNFGGCLVEVQQLCISQDAYSFNKILEAQTQSNGGLTDTPPAAVVGNIRNITNQAEKVVGYFGVANIQKKKIWIDRKEATGKYESLLGHELIVEPPTTQRPPLVTCTKTAFRTPFKPEGWQ